MEIDGSKAEARARPAAKALGPTAADEDWLGAPARLALARRTSPHSRRFVCG